MTREVPQMTQGPSVFLYFPTGRTYPGNEKADPRRHYSAFRAEFLSERLLGLSKVIR